jgi:hypothetical protein
MERAVRYGAQGGGRTCAEVAEHLRTYHPPSQVRLADEVSAGR